MKPIKADIFRAYDIRGVVDRDFDEEWVETLGRAVGTYLMRLSIGSCVVGHDCRHSSPAYTERLAAGLMATGVDVVNVGMVPTPVLYFAVKHLDRRGGVMITASHNPSAYNGFKIVAGESTIHTHEIHAVYEIMASGDFLHGEGVYSEIDIAPSYLNELMQRLRPLATDQKIKLVLDGGNGVGGPLCAELLRRMGAEVVEQFIEPDGDFPNHHPDPVVEANMEALKAAVVREGAHFGLGLDGDGDRVGVIDEKGSMVWGDQVLALYARGVLQDFPGATILGDVKCTHRLFADIEAHGGTAQMCVTGHSVVKAAMRETGAKLGGELSGHMFFADRFYGFDDALYAAARFLEVAAASDTPVSALLADWPVTYSTPELHLACPEEIKFEVVKKAQDHFSQRYEASLIDGVRLLFPDGWGLVRCSNTQPVLVLRFEAESQTRLEEIRAIVTEPLTRWIEQMQE